MSKRAYEVGRGKPRADTQFKPGQSGNPGGRPKGSRNVRSIVDGLLNERVKVVENGRTRSCTKLELIMRQLVNKAAGGEIKNMTLLLKVLLAGTPAAEDSQAEQVHGGKNDEELLADLLKQCGVQLTSTENDDDPR